MFLKMIIIPLYHVDIASTCREAAYFTKFNSL